MAKRAFGTSVVVLLLGAVLGMAETEPRIPLQSSKGECTPSTTLPDVVEAYMRGDWEGLQKQARLVLGACSFDEHTVDLERHYYSIVLVAPDLDSEPRVIRFLAHEPAPPPYRLQLPGLKSPREGKGDAGFFEVYLTTQADARFSARYEVTKMTDPLLTQVPEFLKRVLDPGLIVSAVVGPPEEALPRVYATLLHVPMPHARARISAASFINDPLVQGGKTMKVEAEYSNKPLRRVGFGLVTGALINARAEDRAKVDNGNLTPDPLTGVLTMAVVNVHPRAYDEDLDALSNAERFRLFAGAVLTPEFGVGGGIGIEVVRGFSVNAGAALLFTQRLRDGEEFGQPPQNAAEPLRVGVGTTLFAGIGYTFK